MTPPNSIAISFVRRPARAVSLIGRFVWAAIVLACVSLLWLTLFVLFLPLLIWVELFGLRQRVEDANGVARENTASNIALAGARPANENANDAELIFDRRKDVSKLFGCNTRNVRYRWTLFADRLETLRKEVSTPVALDFGAGSLRDSYELARQGFQVVSVDLDENLLKQYHDSYRWEDLRSSTRVFSGSLDELLAQNGEKFFHLAIAFDVIEHLEDPAAYLRRIRSLLHEEGLFFTIVPNRKSIFERYFKHSIRKQREQGLAWVLGVPHLQFKTPAEWEDFFQHNGFKILEHDMAIGFLVNDIWNGLLGLPIRVYVAPVLGRIAHAAGAKFDGAAFERAFSPAWLMERVDVADQKLKSLLKGRFGWNLIVAQK